MSIVLAFSPAGRVTAIEAPNTQTAFLEIGTAGDADRLTLRVARAFASTQAQGLFTLATEKFDAILLPSLIYWRSFAGR
jgi:hypothetical protein